MPKKERKTLPPLVPLFSDGLHFVRPASDKDQHPMRFLVYQHKVDGLPPNPSLPRHCESLERGQELVAFYTKKACKADPELHRNWQISQGIISPPKPKKEKPPKEPKPVKVKPAKPLMKPPRKPRPPSLKPKIPQPPPVFKFHRFVCIRANPVAQVWRCEKPQGISKTGRPTSKPQRPIDKYKHNLGECAVVIIDTPVLDSYGNVRVFANWKTAYYCANRLYEETPEEETLSNNNDPIFRTTIVYANERFTVHFDPDFNTPLRPFNISHDETDSPYYHNKGKATFASIAGAIKKADELNRNYINPYIRLFS